MMGGEVRMRITLSAGSHQTMHPSTTSVRTGGSGLLVNKFVARPTHQKCWIVRGAASLLPTMETSKVWRMYLYELDTTFNQHSRSTYWSTSHGACGAGGEWGGGGEVA